MSFLKGKKDGAKVSRKLVERFPTVESSLLVRVHRNKEEHERREGGRKRLLVGGEKRRKLGGDHKHEFLPLSQLSFKEGREVRAASEDDDKGGDRLYLCTNSNNGCGRREG